MKIISKYGKLKTINDEARTDAMLKQFTEQPYERHQDMWIRDAVVGNVGVFKQDNYVIEVVMGSEDSSVTTLFDYNPIFSMRTELAEARKELIIEIGAATMSLPSRVAIHDEGRGRDVFLREMSTAQLIDVYEQARKGQLAK